MAGDVRACRSFWEDGFALRTFEIIRREDGSEDGAWLSSTVQGHEVVKIDPGHDGWVVGSEPAVLIEFDFEGDTVRRLGMPDSHRHA